MDLPLPDESLDAVITINTVYFVAELERAFGEIARVLRPDRQGRDRRRRPAAMAGMPVTAHGFTIRPIDELMRPAPRRRVRGAPSTSGSVTTSEASTCWWPTVLAQ